MELTEQDYEIFKKIENLREEQASKDIIICSIDYGAGTPDHNRTQEEMYAGTNFQISYSEAAKVGLKGDYVHYMYSLIKKYKPKKLLELGTCCGFSSLYISKALDDSSVLYTIEGAEELAKIAIENRNKLNCNNVIQVIGRFQDVLDETLEKMQYVDFAFIDGHHDEQATINYFNQIKPYLSSEAIIVFDDIRWSRGMKKAWMDIIQDTHIKKYIGWGNIGICFFKSSKTI